MRLLVVEDDEELSEVMVFQLKKEGYETDFCYSGEEALYYTSSTPYDLIILDRMLPVTGWSYPSFQDQKTESNDTCDYGNRNEWIA